MLSKLTDFDCTTWITARLAARRSCVHGGAAHGHWFDFFAPGFVTDFHVRALDFRGHGDSHG
jgi:pimeloyl-ACP methyl ester carboxylesterase